MMNYYHLDYAGITEEATGYVWPQISLRSPAYLTGRPDSFWDLTAKRFPDFVPNLNYLELERTAKLTDALSGGVAGAGDGIVKGLIVSSRLKEVFEAFRLVPCRYYPAVIKERAVFHSDYYFMHIVSDLSGYIDYEKTKFFVEEYNNDLGPVEVHSEEDFWAKSRQLDGAKIISSHRPCLKKELVSAFDLFVETSFTFKTYISERLKEKLVAEKITGISIKEANDIEIA